MERSRRPVGALAVVLAVTLTMGLAAQPAFATDYPTWSDVEAAKSNEAAKRAEISKIEALLAGLETEAADAAKAALEAAESYNQALDALATASASAETLQRQADAAADTAAVSHDRAGTLIARLSRSGGTDLSLQLFLSDAETADEMLYELGAMSKVSEQAAGLLEKALVDANLAESLSARADAARTARSTLADEAKSAYAEAQTASVEAAARAADQEQVAATLYAQLAALKGTTAAVEKAYLEGLAWEAAQDAVKNPPAPPPPVNPTPPPPNTDAVATAIAFAQAQVGDPYVLNGSGPDQWDCSGLTRASYAAAGVSIGTHSATNQYATMAAAGRLVPYDELVAGDLLFYSSGGSTSGSKYHVTLYIGSGLMIEAPYPGTNVRVKPVRYGDLVPYAGRPTP